MDVSAWVVGGGCNGVEWFRCGGGVLGMVGDFSASHSRIIDKTCFMGGVRWLLSHYAHNKHGGRGKQVLSLGAS